MRLYTPLIPKPHQSQFVSCQLLTLRLQSEAQGSPRREIGPFLPPDLPQYHLNFCLCTTKPCSPAESLNPILLHSQAAISDNMDITYHG
jgi:hypothetical protein